LLRLLVGLWRAEQFRREIGFRAPSCGKKVD
jgi:hypothetical protein